MKQTETLSWEELEELLGLPSDKPKRKQQNPVYREPEVVVSESETVAEPVSHRSDREQPIRVDSKVEEVYRNPYQQALETMSVSTTHSPSSTKTKQQSSAIKGRKQSSLLQGAKKGIVWSMILDKPKGMKRYQ